MSTTGETTIPTLGRDLTPGALYNIHTGEVGPSLQGAKFDRTLVNQSLPIVCHASEMYEKLNISDECRLSILLDPKLVSGSAEVLTRENKQKEQVLLIHTTIKEEIKAEFDRSDTGGQFGTPFTHRIISAQYGMRTILLFETFKKTSTTEPKLIDFVNRLAEIGSMNSVDDRYALERELCQDWKVTVFGDQHCTQMITNAVQFYHDTVVPALGNSRPQSVVLSPLREITDPPISRELISRMSEILSSMRNSVSTCAMLYTEVAINKFPTLKEKIRRFTEAISIFLQYLSRSIRNTLHRVRLGELKPVDLKSNLDRFVDTPFLMNVRNGNTLQEWIVEQVKLCDMLDDADRKRNVRMLPSISQYNSTEITVVFYLGMTTEENEQLNNMTQYLQNASVADASQEEPLSQYAGSASTQNDKLRDFLNLAEKSDFQFVVTEERLMTGARTGGQVRVFREGAMVYEPSNPPAPVICETYRDKVVIAVKASDATKCYEIEVVKDNSPRTITEKVLANPRSITVDGLESGVGYRVRYRYDTIIGPSSFSPYERFNTTTNETAGTPHRAYGVSPSVETGLDPTNQNGNSETDVSNSETIGKQFEDLSFTGNAAVGIPLGVHCDSPSVQSARDSTSHDRCEDRQSNERARVQNRALANSEIVQEGKHGKPTIHRINMKVTNAKCGLRRLTYGPAKSTKPMKTILMVGATGDGKSTLINSFANFLLGVKYEDEYRFRIVDEDLKVNQSKSQTKMVTAYILYHQATFPDELPYSLTIVDTPGFGDTEGIKANDRITDQFRAYFCRDEGDKGNEGIDTLDAIGFVVQASLGRLTPPQSNNFDSVLSLFGQDIKDNIFALITFADGNRPPVVTALKEAKVPYTKSFKFNNSAIFPDIRDASDQTQNLSDDSDGETDRDQLSRVYWRMAFSSYKKFLLQLSKVETKRLALSAEVLDERKRLEVRVVGIEKHVVAVLSKHEQLKQFHHVLKMNEADIDRNKDFTYPGTVTKLVAIPLEKGIYVTNCLSCKSPSCHYPCMIPKDEDIHRCWAMENEKCRVCGCHWSQHRKSNERLEIRSETVTQTVSEKKEKYENARQQSLTTKELMIAVVHDIEMQKLLTVVVIDEVRVSLKRLSEIALKPDFLTTSDYIDTLIQSERYQATLGWQVRVRQLEEARKRAETTKWISEYKPREQVDWSEVKRKIRAGEADDVINELSAICTPRS